MQYYWIEKMFRVEQRQIKTQASLLLNDALSLEVAYSRLERSSALDREGISVENEGWGGNFENKTVVVHVVYPQPTKFVKKCETEEEWYEYTKSVYCEYHISGINLIRLDSAYKVALGRYAITLPFVLVKRDSSDMVLEQMPADIDYNRYNLSLDTIPLGIDGKDFLVARFDGSYYGMFRQMRNTVFISLGIVLLLAAILIYVVHTIFYQKKITRLRNDMVNSIIHDLRGPVTYIRKALPRINVGESQQKYIDAMRRKNERMELMVEKLLITSVGNKAISLRPEPVSLCEYIGDIVDQYNGDNEGLGIRFLCENTSLMATIDRLHFGNAVMNLIDNAMKYSNEKPYICVRCYEETNYICVSVKDHGIGIPQEYMRYLFEKNFRVPEQRSLPRYGFGLGLNYVKIVAKAHGGDVEVRSEYKQGSEFILMIPVIKKKGNA